VKKLDLPPLDPEARSLLERVKDGIDLPAPEDVKARSWARVESVVGPDSGRERLESGVQAQETASAHARPHHVAMWAGAAALFAIAIVALGPRLRKTAPPSLLEHAPLQASSGLGCLPEPSFDADPRNCGRCRHDCCGGACSAGVCQPLVLSQSYHVGRPAVDDTHVYWPEGNDSVGRIMKVPKRGGPTVALATGVVHPWAVAVSGGYVYWVTNRDTPPSFGGVFKVSIDGGEVLPIVPSGEALAGDVLVDGSQVYWDDYGAYLPTQHAPGQKDECVEGALIRKAGLDGSNPTTLASPQSGVCSPLLMTMDSHHVYWPSRFGRTIQKARLDGGDVVTLAAASDPMAVAVDAFDVYWVNWEDGTVQRVPISGGSPVTVASSGAERGPNGGTGSSAIAVDRAHVYWNREGSPWGAGGALLVVPTSASDGRMGGILATSPNPTGLVLDSTCVYWTDGSDGQVRVIAKP
jgi:hypothetical protein